MNNQSQERLSEEEFAEFRSLLYEKPISGRLHWLELKILSELKRLQAIEAERDRYKAALVRIARAPFPEADAIPVEMFYELQLIAKNELKGADTHDQNGN